MTAKRMLRAATALVAILLVARAAGLRSQSVRSAPGSPSSPPAAPVRPVTDDYYGTKVVDPYRYMENLQDPGVQTWFKAQDDYTRAVLASIPGRQQLLERIKQLHESAPFLLSDIQRFEGERYYYRKRLASEEDSQRQLALFERAFAEDNAMIEAQQQVIDRTPQPHMLGIRADHALNQFRRLMDELMAAEAPAALAADG